MGRPKKEAGTTVATTVAKKTVVSAKEKQLENEVEQLKNIVKQMQEMLSSKVQDTAKQPVMQVSREDSDIMSPVGETVDVPFRQYVRVMSLTRHKLTLSTEGFGNGTIFNFTEYGQVQSIIYEDLAKIIHNNPRFTKEGYYFIMDPRVLKIHNLEDDYKNILDKKTMDSILELDVDKIRTLIKGASNHNKNTIVSMIVDKILAGEQVDLNKVRVIGVEADKDIDSIVRSINDSKRIFEEE